MAYIIYGPTTIETSCSEQHTMSPNLGEDDTLVVTDENPYVTLTVDNNDNHFSNWNFKLSGTYGDRFRLSGKDLNPSLSTSHWTPYKNDLQQLDSSTYVASGDVYAADKAIDLYSWELSPGRQADTWNPVMTNTNSAYMPIAAYLNPTIMTEYSVTGNPDFANNNVNATRTETAAQNSHDLHVPNFLKYVQNHLSLKIPLYTINKKRFDNETTYYCSPRTERTQCIGCMAEAEWVGVGETNAPPDTWQWAMMSPPMHDPSCMIQSIDPPFGTPCDYTEQTSYSMTSKNGTKYYYDLDPRFEGYTEFDSYGHLCYYECENATPNNNTIPYVEFMPTYEQMHLQIGAVFTKNTYKIIYTNDAITADSLIVDLADGFKFTVSSAQKKIIAVYWLDAQGGRHLIDEGIDFSVFTTWTLHQLKNYSYSVDSDNNNLVYLDFDITDLNAEVAVTVKPYGTLQFNSDAYVDIGIDWSYKYSKRVVYDDFRKTFNYYGLTSDSFKITQLDAMYISPYAYNVKYNFNNKIYLRTDIDRYHQVNLNNTLEVMLCILVYNAKFYTRDYDTKVVDSSLADIVAYDVYDYTSTKKIFAQDTKYTLCALDKNSFNLENIKEHYIFKRMVISVDGTETELTADTLPFVWEIPDNHKYKDASIYFELKDSAQKLTLISNNDINMKFIKNGSETDTIRILPGTDFVVKLTGNKLFSTSKDIQRIEFNQLALFNPDSLSPTGINYKSIEYFDDYILVTCTSDGTWGKEVQLVPITTECSIYLQLNKTLVTTASVPTNNTSVAFVSPQPTGNISDAFIGPNGCWGNQGDTVSVIATEQLSSDSENREIKLKRWYQNYSTNEAISTEKEFKYTLRADNGQTVQTLYGEFETAYVFIRLEAPDVDVNNNPLCTIKTPSKWWYLNELAVLEVDASKTQFLGWQDKNGTYVSTNPKYEFEITKSLGTNVVVYKARCKAPDFYITTNVKGTLPATIEPIYDAEPASKDKNYTFKVSYNSSLGTCTDWTFNGNQLNPDSLIIENGYQQLTHRLGLMSYLTGAVNILEVTCDLYDTTLSIENSDPDYEYSLSSYKAVSGKNSTFQNITITQRRKTEITATSNLKELIGYSVDGTTYSGTQIDTSTLPSGNVTIVPITQDISKCDITIIPIGDCTIIFNGQAVTEETKFSYNHTKYLSQGYQLVVERSNREYKFKDINTDITFENIYTDISVNDNIYSGIVQTDENFTTAKIYVTIHKTDALVRFLEVADASATFDGKNVPTEEYYFYGDFIPVVIKPNNFVATMFIPALDINGTQSTNQPISVALDNQQFLFDYLVSTDYGNTQEVQAYVATGDIRVDASIVSALDNYDDSLSISPSAVYAANNSSVTFTIIGSESISNMFRVKKWKYVHGDQIDELEGVNQLALELKRTISEGIEAQELFAQVEIKPNSINFIDNRTSDYLKQHVSETIQYNANFYKYGSYWFNENESITVFSHIDNGYEKSIDQSKPEIKFNGWYTLKDGKKVLVSEEKTFTFNTNDYDNIFADYITFTNYVSCSCDSSKIKWTLLNDTSGTSIDQSTRGVCVWFNEGDTLKISTIRYDGVKSNGSGNIDDINNITRNKAERVAKIEGNGPFATVNDESCEWIYQKGLTQINIVHEKSVMYISAPVTLLDSTGGEYDSAICVVNDPNTHKSLIDKHVFKNDSILISSFPIGQDVFVLKEVRVLIKRKSTFLTDSSEYTAQITDEWLSSLGWDDMCYMFDLFAFFTADYCYLTTYAQHTRENVSKNTITPKWKKQRVGLKVSYKFTTVIEDEKSKFIGWYTGSTLLGTEHELFCKPNVSGGTVGAEYSIYGQFKEYDTHITIVSDYVQGTTKYGGEPTVDKTYVWVGDTIKITPNEYNNPDSIVTKFVGAYYENNGRHDIQLNENNEFIITEDMCTTTELKIHAVYEEQKCILTIDANDWNYFSAIKVNGETYTQPISVYKGASVTLSAEMIQSSTYDVVATKFLNWTDGTNRLLSATTTYRVNHDVTVTANGAKCNYFVQFSSTGIGTVNNENEWYYVTKHKNITILTSLRTGGDRYTPDTYISNIAIRNAGSVKNRTTPTFDLAEFMEGLVDVHVTFSEYQTYLDWEVDQPRLATIDQAPSRHWFNYGEIISFTFLCNGNATNIEKKPTYVKTFTINGSDSGYSFNPIIQSRQTCQYTVAESAGAYQQLMFIADYMQCVWVSFAVDPREGHNNGSLSNNFSRWYTPNTALTSGNFPKPINKEVTMGDGTTRPSRFITWWYYNAAGEITDCAYDSTANDRVFVVDISLGEKQTVYARFDVANVYVTFKVDTSGAAGSILTKPDWFVTGEVISISAKTVKDETTGRSTRVAYWYVDVDTEENRINSKDTTIQWTVTDSNSDEKTDVYVKFEAPNIHVYTQNLPGQEQWGYYNMKETWVYNGEVLNLKAWGFQQIFAEGNCKSNFVEWLMESEIVSSHVIGSTYNITYTVLERNGYEQKLSARFELAPSDYPDISDTPSTPSKPSKPPTNKVDTVKWNYLGGMKVIDDVPITQSVIACASPSYDSGSENDKISSGLKELETNKSIPSKYSIAKYYRVRDSKTVIYWIYQATVNYVNSTKGDSYSETFTFDYNDDNSYAIVPINQSIIEVNKTKFNIVFYRKPIDNFNTKDKIRYRGAFTDVLASAVYNDSYTVLLAKISVDLSAYYIQQYVNNDYSFKFKLNYFDHSGNETTSAIDIWEQTYKFPKKELEEIAEWNNVIDLDVYDYTSKLFNYVYDKAQKDKVSNLKTTSILLSMCCTVIDRNGYEYEQPRQLLKLYANGYALSASTGNIILIDQWVPRIEVIKGYPQNTFSYKNLPVRGFSTYKISGQDNDRDGFKLYTQVIGRSTNTNYIKDTFCNLQFLQGSDILKKISESYSDWNYEDNSKRCLLEYEITPGARDVKSTYTLYANNIVGYTRQYEDLKIETETLYGWTEPTVKLEQYFACDSNLIRHPVAEENNRAYLKFSISYSSVGNENKIELSNGDVKLYMRPLGTEHWTEFTVHSVDGYYEMLTDESYELVIGSTYEVMIKVRDYVMRWYSKPHIEYGYNINFWNIPLSLTKSATGDQGAALNAAVGEYEYDLKMYRDVNFKTDSKITSTDGSNTITKDLYNIFARGGQNSVVADDSNVAQNSYVNTLAIKTESEYAKLSELEKSFESKTLYFVVED